MSLGWPFFEMEWSPTTTTTASTTSTRKVEQEHTMQYLSLAPYALLLKHHPMLQNVQPSAPLWTSSSADDHSPPKEPIILTATQPIQAGQELYLDFAQHVQSIDPQLLLSSHNHHQLPTSHHYQEADEIIQDARTTFKAKHFIAKKRQYEIGMGLRMMTKVVARYQPIVASLLPTLVDTLLNFNYEHKGSTSALIMMHNQTKMSLGTFGACMSDIDIDIDIDIDRTSMDRSSQRTTRTTTRSIPTGQRVHPMPLYIRNKTISDWSCNGKDDDQDQDETCTAIYEHKGICLTTTDLTVEICPLQGQVAEITSSPDEANVAYRWSAWKQAVNGTLKSPDVIVKVRSHNNTLDGCTHACNASPKHHPRFSSNFGCLCCRCHVALQNYPTDLLWDLVALKDLEPGEKLIVALERDSTTGQWLIPNELVPNKWRIITPSE
jgi:hypothetical protein